MARNTLIVSILAISLLRCGTQLDQEKLKATYRVGKSLQSAQSLGTNYPKFGELLEQLLTEISIAKDAVETEQEREFLDLYSQALGVYNDSRMLWFAKIEGAGVDFVPVGQILVGRKLAPIVKKYRLETDRHSHYYAVDGKFQTVSEESIQILWSKATKLMDSANRLYNQSPSSQN